VEGVISHAFVARALLETNFSPSSNDKTPLATNAESSPRECPATISGLKFSRVLLISLSAGILLVALP
jgi:hypothetical protein